MTEQEAQNNFSQCDWLPFHMPMGPLKELKLPKWLSTYAISVYFLVLTIVTFVYSSHALPWFYLLSGSVSVIVFFIYAQSQMKELSIIRVSKERNFEKKLFWLAFVPRFAWMFLIYYINVNFYGDEYGFDNADATFYRDMGEMFADSFRNGTFRATWKAQTTDISDLGYSVYVGLIYRLTNNSVIVLRLLKCVWSSITAILIYRLTKRNFDVQVARVAAILCALWPNFWYYCGTHLKETEMVFLAVLFVDQADQMLRSRQFSAWKVIPVLSLGAVQFGFRTPLALVEFLALIFTVVMSSQKVVSWEKRIIVGALAIVLIGVTMGNRIQEESRQLMDSVRSNQQQQNMEWRSRRQHGNSFAKYAGATVFAPMIFTIPFPSMVRIEGTPEMPQLLNGGNFGKNIMSFFLILALVILLMTGKWRDHMLPLAFMLGYVVVLTMSAFAQSERFHQPAMPFEFMFAAYGISIAVKKKKYKRWFTYWCGLMFVAGIAWNWFKMAGRGL